MPVMNTVITAAAPQARAVRSSGLLKLSLTELKLLSRAAAFGLAAARFFRWE